MLYIILYIIIIYWSHHVIIRYETDYDEQRGTFIEKIHCDIDNCLDIYISQVKKHFAKNKWN